VLFVCGVFMDQGHRMCRLDGRIRGKEERQVIISRFSKDLSYSSFLLTTQVRSFVGLDVSMKEEAVIAGVRWIERKTLNVRSKI
jgi:hypothetical protein